MEDKDYDHIINKILHPDFEVSINVLDASDKHIKHFLLGVLSHCTFECAKFNILTPSICIKVGNGDIVFNNTVNIKSIADNFHIKADLIPMCQFDFVFQKSFKNQIFCFQRGILSENVKDSLSIFPLYKPFSELVLSDFYNFIHDDINELKNELPETSNNETLISIRVHVYDDIKRNWEIIFID